MTSLYTRAKRYGLDEEMENVFHALGLLREAWTMTNHVPNALRLGLFDRLDALTDAVKACDSLGGHEHEDGIETGSKGGLR